MSESIATETQGTYLQMLPVSELRLVFLLEILGTIALGGVELGKVTLVVVETLAVLMDDICRDGVQECSVVRAERKTH